MVCLKGYEENIHKTLRENGGTALQYLLFDSEGNDVSYGNISLKEDEVYDRDTIYGVASVTKSFVALSVLMLENRGLIDTEDPVSTYIPEFTGKNMGKPLLIRHLLTHTGGFWPLKRILLGDVAKELGIEDSLENGLEHDPVIAESGTRVVAERLDDEADHIALPGQQMSYCNDGYALLSEIVKRVSHKPSFASYIEDEVFTPLGMERSNLGFLRNSLDSNAALLRSIEDGVLTEDRDYIRDAFVLSGTGGIKSTINDLKNYVLMYLHKGKELGLGRDVIDEMLLPRVLTSPGTQYCYGLEHYTSEDHEIYTHSGSLPGVSSCISFSYDQGMGLIMLCNTMGVPVSALSKEFMTKLSGELEFSYDDRFTGIYGSGEDDDLEVLFNEEPFMRKGNDIKKMRPSGRLSLRSHDGSVLLKFLEDCSGRVYAVRCGSRIFRKKF
ncbi:MAG: beta-lactamase family protein [Clostridia bacterium]|nr:beta-lactamase family protein [Clostridia bacterium]